MNSTKLHTTSTLASADKVVEQQPAPEVAALFPPSVELGTYLNRLHDQQRAIDRQAVERLARLRELADRD